MFSSITDKLNDDGYIATAASISSELMVQDDGGMDDGEAQCYLNRYPDLAMKFGPKNIGKAKKHWKNKG